MSERYSTHLSHNVSSVSQYPFRRHMLRSRISGLLFTIITFIVLSLCCGFGDAATAPNPALREYMHERDLLVRAIALTELKQKFVKAVEEFGNDRFSGSKVNDSQNESDSFLKLPPSLRQKLEKQQTMSQSDRDGEVKREYAVIAKPGLFHWPQGGSKEGFYFDIPDEVPHETIQSAEVIFDEVSPVTNYSLFFMSEQSNETLLWSLLPASSCRTARQPFRRCTSMKVQVQQDIEHMLFLSGNLQSTFQLRFFLINTNTKEPILWKGISETPVLHLKYTIRTRKLRQVKEITQRECSSSIMETCCLVRSSVSLKELGWDHIVSSPFNIDFNYCRGSCIGTQDHHTTYNALMRQAIALRYGNSMNTVKLQAFKPCCAPYDYESIGIWRKGAPGAWSRIVLKDAKVTACACV